MLQAAASGGCASRCVLTQNRWQCSDLRVFTHTADKAGQRINVNCPDRQSDRSCKYRTAAIPQAVSVSAAAGPLPSMLQAIGPPTALALTVLSTFAITAWMGARRRTAHSDIITQRTEFSKGVLSRCPTINAPYQAFPLLTNGHVETIFASKTRRSPPVLYERESFGTPDGGTVHLDYHNLPASIVGSCLSSSLPIQS